MPNLDDVRILIPRIRRALDPSAPSATAASGYADDQIKDLAADAIGMLVMVGGTDFPFTLEVSSRNIVTNYPEEYITVPELPIEVQNLVAYQAAIEQCVSELKDLKTKEKISDEGSSWEWEKSSAIIRDKIKSLQDMRDRALARLSRENFATDIFINILEERDLQVDRLIEPYYYD